MTKPLAILKPIKPASGVAYVALTLSIISGCAPHAPQSRESPALSPTELIALQAKALEKLMSLTCEGTNASPHPHFVIDLSSETPATAEAILAALRSSVGSDFDFEVLSGRQSDGAIKISAEVFRVQDEIVEVTGWISPGSSELGIFTFEFSRRGNSFIYRGISARASS